MIHILFEGSPSACSKWLPFAKDRLRQLEKIYSGRRFWTWERGFGDARVSIERNGQVSYIRITAGLKGYEFSTVIDIAHVPPGGAPGVFSILTFAGEHIKVRNYRGSLLQPDNAEEHLDLQDRWLYSGQYGDPDTGTNFYPTQDWFELPVVEDDEEAAAMRLSEGRRAGRITFWRGYRSRHYDLSLWRDYFLGIVTPQGSVFTVTSGRKAKRTGLSLITSEEAEGSTGHFPRAGGACWQGRYLLAASWRGDDFKFEARAENYENYIEGSQFFQLVKPAWVKGDVFSPWYWRGDGKRCVSLQYGLTPRPEEGVTLENYDPDVDAGFVEAEILLEETADGEPPIIAWTEFVQEQHSLGDLGIHPAAIDYDMLDQRHKRAFYFVAYIGPIRVSGYSDEDPENPTTFYARDLLIYLVSANIEGEFPGEEHWRIPVWHGCGWEGTDTRPGSEDDGDPLNDATEIGGIYWTTGVTYPQLTGKLEQQAPEELHPYLDLRTVIVGMDARADAVAMHHQVTMRNATTGLGQDSTPWFGRHWRIWGETRENSWIKPDLDSERLGPGPGFTAHYDWLEAEAPPADVFGYLAEIPSGYEIFEKGSTFDFPRVQTGLQSVLSTVLQQLVYLTPGIGENTPYRSYNGFRVSPTRSFAVIANNRSYFIWVNTTFTNIPSAYGVPDSFWVIDHIEKYRGPDKDPVTETHYGIYNDSRDTDWTPGDITELASACINGLWVE